MIFGFKKDPRKSSEWRDAERQHQDLYRKSGFSFFGTSALSGAMTGELDAFYGQLLNVCPVYYPGWLALGYHRFRRGKNGDGLQYLFKALECIHETVSDPEEIEKILHYEAQKLERMMCYAETAQWMEKAVEYWPEAAGCYDDWAYCIANIPGESFARAKELQQKALALSPEDSAYLNNMGWICLLAGELAEAEQWFGKASEYSADDDAASQNMEVAAFLKTHRTNYMGYLLRTADRKKLAELEEDEEIEDWAVLIGEYNSDRRDAFKMKCFYEKNMPPHLVLDAAAPLEYFTQVMQKAMEKEGEVFPLYEDLFNRSGDMKALLIRFIRSAPHLDDEYLGAVGESLKDFVLMFENAGLCSKESSALFLAGLVKEIAFFQPLLETFTELQLDVTLTEAERQVKIADLFGIEPALLEKEQDEEDVEE